MEAHALVSFELSLADLRSAVEGVDLLLEMLQDELHGLARAHGAADVGQRRL